MRGGTLDVRRHGIHRWVAAIVAIAVTALISAPSGVTATPGGGPGGEGPDQQDASDEDEAAGTDRALVDIGDTVADDPPAEVAGALSAMATNVETQLNQLEAAQAGVAMTIAALADADSAVQETQMRIDELTARSDQIVIDAFMMPPAEGALDVFTAENIAEAAIKQNVLSIQADSSADVLTRLDDQRGELEDLQELQQVALDDAEEARSEAEAALADLEAAVSQQTQFVIQVRERLDDDLAEAEELEATDPELAAQIRQRQAALAAELESVLAAQAQQAALEALAEAERRAVEEGLFLCPVDGPVTFTDTWGAARSGGRTHQGTDIMAARGTPTVAPVSGEVVHRENDLGGLTWYVYGDDNNTYYGAHLSSYENVGVGWVSGGTVIGYVGTSGNAPDDAPHLHFEYHPGGGSAVNPYSRLVRACG